MFSNPTLSASRDINYVWPGSVDSNGNEAGITPAWAAPKGRGKFRGLEGTNHDLCDAIYRRIYRGNCSTRIGNGSARSGSLAIENMSWDEKLRAMEELWESLSRDEARLESPPWHKEALRETVARHDAGKEQPID
jgi:hypothetical protein